MMGIRKGIKSRESERVMVLLVGRVFALIPIGWELVPH